MLCDWGLVALAARHKSHNIPGKFLTYMQSGLPVLATINAGNDLAEVIRENAVGKVSEGGNLEELEGMARALIDGEDGDPETYRSRCRGLFTRMFSAPRAVSQITNALNGGSSH